MIAERKDGLSAYLKAVLSDPQFRNSSYVSDFLTENQTKQQFDPEDALPSTLSRKAALSMLKSVDTKDVETAAVPISGAYFPDWSSVQPESVDFSKYDILWFGEFVSTLVFVIN